MKSAASRLIPTDEDGGGEKARGKPKIFEVAMIRHQGIATFGTITYPTKRAKENHRLKHAGNQEEYLSALEGMVFSVINPSSHQLC